MWSQWRRHKEYIQDEHYNDVRILFLPALCDHDLDYNITLFTACH